MSGQTRTFSANMNAFPQVAAFIEQVSAAAGFCPEDRHKVTLVLEELFSNTVFHGHGGDSEQPVRITLEPGAGRITLLYEDDGPPHNPFEWINAPDPDLTLEKRRVGGLGVVLVARIARNIGYAYSDGHNQVTLTFISSKPLEPPPPGQ